MKAETNNEYLTEQSKSLIDFIDEHQNIGDINCKCRSSRFEHNFSNKKRGSGNNLFILASINMGFRTSLEKCQLAQELKVIFDRYLFKIIICLNLTFHQESFVYYY